MVSAGVDGSVHAATGAEERGYQTGFAFDVDAFVDVVAELILLAAAPDVDLACLAKGHTVVGTAGYVGDLSKFGIDARGTLSND